MLRVLGSVRLSRDTDATTSPARQRERIGWWAGGNDGQVIHIAEDLDVSGAAYPFDRPELGQWLTDERAHEWDVLCAWKLDRISRSSMDTEQLLRWCMDRGKRIVCVDDGIDTSTQMGQVWVKLASIFAEVERNAIKERTAKGKAKLRQDGRWSGEAVHYGYQAVKHPDGWRLEIEPEAYNNVRHIVARFLDGYPVESIARELTDAGVPTPRDHQRKIRGREPQGKPWRAQSLFKILESRTLLGHTLSGGEPLIVEGEIIQKAEPVVTLDEFNAIQERLKSRRYTKQSNRRTNASPLLHVAYCYECEQPLYLRTNTINEKVYRYYHCADKHTQQIPADMLEEATEEALLNEIGHVERHEEKYIPASDSTAELESAKATMNELIQAMQRASSQTAREALSSQIMSLDEKISTLEQQPVEPSRVEHVPTGRTFRQEWTERGEQDRRSLLVTSGLKAFAFLTGKGRANGEAGSFTFSFYIPDEILERLHSV